MKFKFVVPGTDTGKDAKFQQFLTGFAEHAEALGYDAPDVEAVTTVVAAATAALEASTLAKDQAQQAVSAKDEAIFAANELVRFWAQAVKTNPLAEKSWLADMGIVPASEPVGPVTVPTDLSASASAGGTATLQWAANGNKSGTTYVLESSTDGANWAYLGSTTKRKFTDEAATPGVMKVYRVKAQRAGLTSAASSWSTIYPVAEGFSLQEAA